LDINFGDVDCSTSLPFQLRCLRLTLKSFPTNLLHALTLASISSLTSLALHVSSGMSNFQNILDLASAVAPNLLHFELNTYDLVGTLDVCIPILERCTMLQGFVLDPLGGIEGADKLLEAVPTQLIRFEFTGIDASPMECIDIVSRSKQVLTRSEEETKLKVLVRSWKGMSDELFIKFSENAVKKCQERIVIEIARVPRYG
jgi:hypothetical protein